MYVSRKKVKFLLKDLYISKPKYFLPIPTVMRIMSVNFLPWNCVRNVCYYFFSAFYMTKTKYASLLVAGMLMSCGEDNPSAPEAGYLVSAEKINTYSLAELKTLVQLTGQSGFSSLVTYGISTYKVTYHTTFQQKRIKASGLLFLPEANPDPAPFISLQHGTMFIKEQAPSASGDFSGMEYFASAGYIAVMPDYIGYGSSSDVFHPYYDRTTSALSVIDLIKATQEFLTKQKVTFNEQLFLAGYSEGGYVTLAAAHELETNPEHGLTITAVAAGAGGYDLEEMLRNITTQDYYAYPSYLAFVVMSYNNTYQWNKPLNYFFRDKYAAALETYMNGDYDGWQINAKLTTDVPSLLSPDFLERLRTEGEETEFKNALKENSLSGWKTSIPMKLYHGTKDEIIPYQNSQIALDNFKKAESADVTLTLIENGTHGSSYIPMLKQFVPWFESLRE